MTYLCTICEEPIKGDSAVTIYCGHVFDGQCIERQINRRMFSCPICHQISNPEDIAPLFDHNEEGQVMETMKQEETKDAYKIEYSKLRQSEDQIESVKFEKEQLLTRLPILVKQYISSEKQKRSLKKKYFEESDSRKKNEYCKGYFDEKTRHESQQRNLFSVVTKIEELQHNYRMLLNECHTLESLGN